MMPKRAVPTALISMNNLHLRKDSKQSGALKRLKENLNYYCIMMEGLFNTLGVDILGVNTIIPLFLSDFGAGTGLIGSLASVHSIAGAVMPLLSGGFIAAAVSKRRISLLFNGLSRGLILTIPVILLLGLPNNWVTGCFMGVMLVYFFCQPITGTTWNYLLGACVEPRHRGKLMGTLFAISGFITFGSSNIIKVIREAGNLSQSQRYALIFGLAGILLSMSVLFFIPLKEKKVEPPSKEGRSLKAYIGSLAVCFQNRDFRRMIATNACSHASTMINAFIYVYAQNVLEFGTKQVSNLLIIQTVGIVIGGFTTGRISSRFGTKRMLLMVESLGITIPLLELLSGRVMASFWPMAVAVFLMGFSRSGYMGYQTHLLEIVPGDKAVYYIVSKSMVMLPLSLISAGVGFYMERFPIAPVFVFQIVLCLGAVFCATRLKLIVYKKDAGETPAEQE